MSTQEDIDRLETKLAASYRSLSKTRWDKAMGYESDYNKTYQKLAQLGAGNRQKLRKKYCAN